MPPTPLHGTSLVLTVVVDRISLARSLISFIEIIIIRIHFKSNENKWSNKKLGKIQNFRQRGKMIYTTNVLPNDRYIHDEALMNRFYPVGVFKKLDEVKSIDEELKDETPYVYLYCGLQYIRTIDNDPIKEYKIYNNIDDEKEKEINELIKYFSEDQYDNMPKKDIYGDEDKKSSKRLTCKTIYDFHSRKQKEDLIKYFDKIRNIENE